MGKLVEYLELPSQIESPTKIVDELLVRVSKNDTLGRRLAPPPPPPMQRIDAVVANRAANRRRSGAGSFAGVVTRMRLSGTPITESSTPKRPCYPSCYVYT